MGLVYETVNIIQINYSGSSIEFREDGWFNATRAAAKYGKRPVDWLRLPETERYIDALSEVLGISEKISLIKSRRNSGTWLHPKLAVRFAQWLDVRFAVWCDMQIDAIITKTHPHYDWKKIRHEATSSYKVMSAVMQLHRQLQGKETKTHHFINEAKLINWSLTGEFKGLDRELLNYSELDLLAKLEERNTVLIGCGLSYQERKQALECFAKDWRKTDQLVIVA